MSKLGQQTKSDFLPMDEYRSLISRLDNDKRHFWSLYMVFSASTALRISDVLSTRWCDILEHRDGVLQMRSRFIKKEKKTGKHRIINFSKSTSEKLMDLYDKMGNPGIGSFIFQSKHNNGAVSPQYINQELKRIKSRYNVSIDNFSSHSLRKTFARAAWENAGRSAESLVLLMDVLNHSSLAVTKTYLGIKEEEIAGVYNQFEL